MFSKLTLSLLLAPLTLSAQDVVELDALTVEGRGSLLVGEALSASQGIIGQIDLQTRPMLRTGEVLEAVPGMIVTQHSGTGKANQYFLRGFNLDHGTDFATWIDGMPVNMVSHGHGQGYTDLNFIIPELVDNISYLKGSYYSEVGDFSSAGSASIQTMRELNKDMVSVDYGEDGYLRVFGAASQSVGDGTLLIGAENVVNNGPWDIDENLNKINGLVTYSAAPREDLEYAVTLMAYDSSWDSADQIPDRAVKQGLITPFGSIDDTVGGSSSRYSLSGNITKNGVEHSTKLSAYTIYYDMDLWSNFTYFLDNPVEGDQFQQSDRRTIYGTELAHTIKNAQLFGNDIQQTLGLQTRYDAVDKVGLYKTQARQILSTNREDSVDEYSLSAYYDASLSWSKNFRTNFGARLDYFNFDVESDFAANSGNASDSLFSPKFNAIYTPTEETELYLSAGYGFHSNDARGATISIDPSDRVTPLESVDLLVQSLGYELGIRHHWTERSNTSVALWTLDLDSELLYVGDAGNTEASRPSERVGIEFANYFVLTDALSLDLDAAFTDSSYSDVSADGDEIPGAIDSVLSLGFNYNASSSPWFGSVRYRYFSDRPLIEDGSERSDSFGSVNLKIGYKSEDWRVSLDLLNAFDSQDSDITYFYGSRLPGEPAGGIEDRHYHIIQPRSLRLNVTKLF